MTVVVDAGVFVVLASGDLRKPLAQAIVTRWVASGGRSALPRVDAQ
jgi:hypothetical protein